MITNSAPEIPSVGHSHPGGPRGDGFSTGGVTGAVVVGGGTS